MSKLNWLPMSGASTMPKQRHDCFADTPDGRYTIKSTGGRDMSYVLRYNDKEKGRYPRLVEASEAAQNLEDKKRE